MKTPIGTVMSRLHRGRRLLRDLLAGYALERGLGSAQPASGAAAATGRAQPGRTTSGSTK